MSQEEYVRIIQNLIFNFEIFSPVSDEQREKENHIKENE